jgi:hypothetical protein
MAFLRALGVAPFAPNVYVNRDYPLPTREVNCILVGAQQDAQRKLAAAGMGCPSCTKPKNYAVPLGYYKHQMFVLPTSSPIRSKLGYYGKKKFVLPTSSRIHGLGWLGQDDGSDLAAAAISGGVPLESSPIPNSIEYVPPATGPNVIQVGEEGGQPIYQVVGAPAASAPNIVSGAAGPGAGFFSPQTGQQLANLTTSIGQALTGQGAQQQSALASLSQPIPGIGLSPLTIGLGVAAVGGFLLLLAVMKK